MLKSIITTAALAATLAPLAATPARAQGLASWRGTYVWEESLGRIGGNGHDGFAAFVTRTLTLGPAAGATGCRLNSEGFQTYEQIKYSPKGLYTVLCTNDHMQDVLRLGLCPVVQCINPL